MSNLTLVAPKELVKASKQKCLNEDLSLSEVVRGFLRQWIAGEIATPPAEVRGE